MNVIPSTRPIPDRHTSRAKIRLRYEDLTQEGRLRLIAMPECLSRTTWGKLIGPSRLYRQLTAQGIVAVLTRLAITAGAGPLSIQNPLNATGRLRFAHTLDDDAEVQRIVLNMWGEAEAPLASTRDPQPPNAGTSVSAGRIFAEHTLTRPFAPAGARSVTQLEDIDGLSPFPKERYLGESPRALLALPRGATALEAYSMDAPPIVFGLDDTDDNQHVNALVYLRLFRVAALQRLAKHQSPEVRQLQTAEIGFRKPCFAGEQLYLRIRAFHLGSRTGALCTLGPQSADRQPSCYARLTFGS